MIRRPKDKNGFTNNAKGSFTSRGKAIGQSMLRKLGDVDEEERQELTYTGNSRWMIPYADLLTVLLGMFIVLYSASNLNNQSLSSYATDMETELSEKEQQLEDQNLALLSLHEQLANLETLSIPIVIHSDEIKPDSENPSDLSNMTTERTIEGIEVNQQQRGVVISLQDSILFHAGKANLDTEAKKTLDRLADILQATSQPIRIEGHTDNTPIKTGQYPSNWELSTARATEIVKYLIEQRKFDPQQLSAVGYGEFRPIASNSSIEGKQKNRRVDIVVLNSQSALQEPISSQQDGTSELRDKG